MREEFSFNRYLDDFSREGLERIRRAKIGIAGAGGLGSNCASYLVRSCFENLVIADFDTVVPSNLNRQFYFTDQIGLMKTDALSANLLRINPDVNLTMRRERVDERNVREIFSGCDAVIEAFDVPESKALLVDAMLRDGIFTVCASGLAGIGRSDDIVIHRINDRLYVVGDMKSSVNADKPPCAPRVAAVAAKQADIVLEYIMTGVVRAGGDE